ncbi:TIGR03862 family flavoprotein [Maritalea mediterranea]|uniref:TIGR03862 family flavoprotein n=1 Tax=Maritalea mediterranea TaxID=2909667 RepID=A0ABS9EBE5_9HYPH|nr:TIGR03862 family flavoprotein [Maritalea mediterranea]MCF4099209.1 TIGR03862 family flavoprotein [Maritalea mediterranea]
MTQTDFAIIGGGPAGLAAAELLSQHGRKVTIYEAMPTPARKFLMAGKSGLNLTHNEDFEQFKTRFGAALPHMAQALDDLMPMDIRRWANELGADTFVGSSGRVFPKVMKASPLLRNWLKRLEKLGVTLKTRHRWQGFDGEKLSFQTLNDTIAVQHDAVVLALGGVSWPRLGGNGDWVNYLEAIGVEVAPFQPANCGFEVEWSDFFKEKFAGAPIKSVSATSKMGSQKGEFVIAQHGVEGSLIYHHSAALRDEINAVGHAALVLDLVPDQSLDKLTANLEKQNQKQSFSNRLRKGTKLTGAKAALIREVAPDANKMPPNTLAKLIKALPLPLTAPRPIKDAISSAGGVKWGEVDANYMLKKRPGLFVAGEMLDWEAPTGGYLLTACFATGRAAAYGALKWSIQK